MVDASAMANGNRANDDILNSERINIESMLVCLASLSRCLAKPRAASASASVHAAPVDCSTRLQSSSCHVAD